MPRTTTTEKTLYRFDELSDEAKARAVSDGATNLFDGWSEFTIDYATEVAEAAGFCKPKIYWSGFWSQGDGACIEGTWYASDVSVGGEWPEEVSALLAPFRNAPKGLSATLRHRGHYYHEQSVSIDFEWDHDSDEPFPQDAADTLEEAMRDLMRWVYRPLEAECEYQTSTETFEESAEANGWEFYENGALA